MILLGFMEIKSDKISKTINKTVKFAINNNLPESTACQVFLAEPETAKEKKLGQLAIIVQITMVGEENQEIQEAIFQEMRQSYYARAEADISLEEAFEKALQELNKRFNNFFVSRDTKINWLNHLNLLIAVIKDQELHLAPVGRVAALMLWQDRLIEIYKPESEEVNPLKIFSQVFSGELRKGAVIVLSNNNLKDYLTEEKVRQSLKLPFEEIGRHLKNLFWPINNLSLGTIIIARAEEEIEEVITYQSKKILSPQKSMSNLLNIQSKTQSLLSTSLITDIKKICRQAKEFIRVKVLNKRPQPKTLEKVYQAPKPTKESILTKITFQVLLGLKKISKLIRRVLQGLFSLFRDLPGTKQRIKESPYEIEGSIVRAMNRFKKLPKISKVLFLAAIILIFLFSGSIVFQGIIKDKQQASEEYQQVLLQIEEKENSVEANVSIKNYDKAREILASLENDLTNLTQKNKEQREKYSEIENQLVVLKNKVNRLTDIPGPTILADLATKNATQSEALTLINDQLYVFDQKDQIFKISSEGSITVIDSTFEEGADLITATNLDNRWLIYSNNKQIVELSSTDESFQFKDISLPEEEVSIKDMSSYQGRIYLLDPSNNQVYKHTRLTNSYTSGSRWRTDETINLEDATSIAVDGFIWVLKANGEIIKMLSGRREDWTPEEFEPKLDKPIKIFTDINTKNLYILDPVNKRLVVLDKEGKLINQYRSDQFDNLIDFTIQEAQRIVYLLNGQKIYKIQL